MRSWVTSAFVSPLRGESSKRRQASAERVWALQLTVAREDLVSAGDAVGVLDVDVQTQDAASATPRLDDAIRAYMGAGEALELAQRSGQLRRVAELLERCRYEIACARAALQGGVQAPVHLAPCLLDPRHGPACDERAWAPAEGAAPRAVPVCAADAARIGAGDPVTPRLLSLGGDGIPYWQMPAGYAAMLVGYYDAFGGAERLAAALAGTPLGDQLRALADKRR